MPSTSEGRRKEEQHVRHALRNCGYPNWAFNKCKTRQRQDRKEVEQKGKGVSLPYVSGVAEKLKRVYGQYNIPVYFKPGNTLRQKLVHPKDKTPHHKQSNVIYAIQCSQEDCSESYIGETKQLLHMRMSQHRSRKDSAVHIHLKETGHTFTNSDVRILAREPRWSERGVKEAIFVKQHMPSLNREGGLRHNLSPIYNPILLKD